jgi:tetratricopeptide (TPR) repeat protein
MPKSSTIDIPHVSITDHKIGIHSKDSLNSKGSFIGLVSINNPNPSNDIYAKAYLYQFEKFDRSSFLLDSAYRYIKKLDINYFYQDYIHFYYLKKDYKAIINVLNIIPNLLDSLNKVGYQNEHAWTSYRIGKAYENLKITNQALIFHKKACQLAPYILEFRIKLAGIYFSTNEFELAESAYRFVVNEFPKNELAWCNLGFTLVKMGKVKEGEECLNKAYQLNPRHIQTLLNMSSFYLLNNNVKLATDFLNKVLKIDSNNQKAKYLLDQLK